MKEAYRKLILQIMFLLSIIGLIIAGYQTYEHYFLTSSICDISATFSCSTVMESRYGEFPPDSGIAVGAYGVLWWGVLIALSYKSLKKAYGNQEFYILSWLIIGLLFVLYLLVIELYVLPKEIGAIVICPLCTVQHVLIGVLLILSFLILRTPIKEYLENLFSIFFLN